MKLDIIYINLESATTRNNEFVKNFQECAFTDDWRLHRLMAVSGQSQMVQDTPGPVTNNLKGAHHSHLESIRLSK